MVEKTQHSIRNFKLWESYGRNEEQLFFGRDREVKALYDKTFASNLLLLYGASGTGKTSLIQCGLGNMFEDSDWYPIFVRKGDNIIKSLSVALRKEADDPDKLRNNSIKDKIHELFLEKFRPVFLIFDQFEELFILGTREEQDQFFRLLLELLNVNFQCKIILSIKEDYLADLDRYEEAIPVLFNNRMRVERMRTEQLEDVIMGMTKKLGIRIGEPEDDQTEREKVISNIIEKVREPDTHRVDLGELQIFMDELFSHDEIRLDPEGIPSRPIQFDRQLVQGTDEVNIIIAKRLQELLEDLDQKFQQKANVERLPYLLLQDLITDVETKHTKTVGELVNLLFKSDKIAPEYVKECIEDLVDSGILRNLSLEGGAKASQQLGAKEKEQVEIVHDNLAKRLHPLLFNEERTIIKIKTSILNQYEYYQKTGVLLNRKGLEYIQPYLEEIEPGLDKAQQKFLSKSQKEIRKRELKGTITMVGVILILAISAAFAFFQWSRSSRLSTANRISAKALDAYSYDRTLSLRLADSALVKDQKNTLANNVRNDVLLSSWRFPFYQEVIKIKGDEIGRISDLDISKNHKYLLVGSLDGQIYIRNLKASDSLITLTGRHDQEITDVDFVGKYPGNGLHFITSSRDGAAKLWNFVGSPEVKPLMEFEHGEPLSAVKMAFPDKKKGDTMVITAGDKRILFWDWEEKDCLLNALPAPRTTAFEYIENKRGRFLFAAGKDSLLRFFNYDTGATFSYKITEGAVSAMDFSDDNKEHNKLVAGLENGRLIIWKIEDSFYNATNAKKEEYLRTKAISEKAHTEAIKDIVFLKDGTQILTSSGDKSAKLWDKDIRLLKTFLGHNDGVQTITAYKDAIKDRTFVYTGGEDKTIKLWDLDLPIYSPNSIQGLSRGTTAIDYAPDSDTKKLLICKNDQELSLYEKDGWGEYALTQKISYGGSSKISDIAISGNGERILLAFADSPVAILQDIDETNIDSLHHAENGSITGVDFSRDGTFILTSGGAKVVLWKKNSAMDHFQFVDSLNYPHPVNKAIVASDDEKEEPYIILTTIQGGNKAFLGTKGGQAEIAHTDDILSVALSPDGQYFLTGSQDNSFIIGSVSKSVSRSESFPRIQRHNADVRSVAFLDHGGTEERFLSADGDGIVRLWSLKNEEPWEEKSIINHGAPVLKALFLSETRILTLGTQGEVKIWDTGQVEDFIRDDIYQLQ